MRRDARLSVMTIKVDSEQMLAVIPVDVLKQHAREFR
jgi:hypothetical protein